MKSHGRTTNPDLQETLAYYVLATKANLKPWEVDRMDNQMVEEWLEIISTQPVD